MYNPLTCPKCGSVALNRGDSFVSRDKAEQLYVCSVVGCRHKFYVCYALQHIGYRDYGMNPDIYTTEAMNEKGENDEQRK